MLQTPPHFRHLKADGYQLFLQGDVFQLAGVAFAGPRDERLLPTLLEMLRNNIRNTLVSLEGQCSLVFITPQAIHLYRSPFSPFLLFHTHTQASNDCAPLLKDGFSLSRKYLQEFVLDFPSLQFSSPLTPFEGVFRVPPHTWMTITADSAPSSEALPFQPYDLVETEGSLESTAQELKQTLERVLMWHLKKPGAVAAELSGGLDSSFITSFLADLQPIGGVSAHMYSYRKHPSHALSESCAQTVAQEKRVALTVIDSATIENIDISRPAPYQNEPIDFFWQGLLLGPSCADLVPNQSLLFTGFGCDQLFMRNNAILEALMIKKGIREAWPYVKEIARSLNRPTWNFAFQHLISSLPPTLLIRLLDTTRNLKLNPFKIDELAPQMSRFERISWMRYAQNIHPVSFLWDLNELGNQQEARFFSSHLPHSNLNYLVAPQYVIGPYLQPKQIEYVHPFCDSRMIEFAFRKVPFYLIHDFINPYKHLLREAQKGITPESVRTRKKDEFSFDGYFYHLLKTNEDFLRELLEEALAEYPDLIQSDALWKSFEAMLFGSYSNSEVKLARLISYLVWKRNFHASI